MSVNLDNPNEGEVTGAGWSGEAVERQAAAAGRAGHPLKLRLYVAAYSTASRRARRNLDVALGILQPERVELEVIDAALSPERAADDGVFVTPLLVRLAPGPRRRLGGTLDDQKRLLALLSGWR